MYVEDASHSVLKLLADEKVSFLSPPLPGKPRVFAVHAVSIWISVWSKPIWKLSEAFPA
jgi:hypothetical protein